MNGYRKMISDNIPKTWDLALRFCKCRTYWIEYIYNEHVKKYNNDYRSKRERARLKAQTVKRYCGKTQLDFGGYITFDLTINRDKLLLKDKEQYDYWTKIIDWVKWFTMNTIYIENLLVNKYKESDEELIQYISTTYKLNDKELCKFLVKHLRVC